MTINFLDSKTESIFNKNKPLYRYCSFENALNTISNRSLWFSNPVKWPDPFEKLFIEANFQVNGNKQNFPFKDRLFCMCVTQKENCEATWNAYANKNISIRLEINSKGLIELLNSKNKYDVYIGIMDYNHPTKDLIRNEGPDGFDMKKLFDITDKANDGEKLKLLFFKRPAFEYEEEIRIILVSNKSNKNGENILIDKPKDKIAKKGAKDKSEFPVFIKHVIPSIKIGPSPNKTLVKSIRKIFKNLVDSQIQESDLYKDISKKTYKIE